MKMKSVLLKGYELLVSKYFIFSYLTVIGILIVRSYTGIELYTLSIFNLEGLKNFEIHFYLACNLITCMLHHVILNKIYKLSTIKVLSIIWIVPLILLIVRIVYHILYYLIY